MAQAKSLKSHGHVYAVADGDLLSHHFIIEFFETLSPKKKKGRKDETTKRLLRVKLPSGSIAPA